MRLLHFPAAQHSQEKVALHKGASAAEAEAVRLRAMGTCNPPNDHGRSCRVDRRHPGACPGAQASPT